MTISDYHKTEKELEKLPSIQEYMEKRRHPSFYLERIRMVSTLLGNPENLFQYVHIGGTAGKGSTTMYLHNILASAGFRVSSYLSPHVTTATERIMINGNPIGWQDYLWAWQELKPSIKKISAQKGKLFAPSYFEAQFLMSLLLFKKKKIQWVALEVGCGGAFDATNIIPPARVTIITNVHLDHMQLLGRTRSAIAKTKAGIIKRGTAFITGEHDPKIRKLLVQRAKALQVPSTFIPPVKKATIKNNTSWENSNLGRLTTQHLGANFAHNAELAIAAARILQIHPKAIVKGIAKTRLPARTEFMQKNPDVLLDGAHNPAKMKALLSIIRFMRYASIHAIIGMGHSKPAKQILRQLAPYIDSVYFTASDQDVPPAEKPKVLQKVWKTITKKPSRVFSTPRKALEHSLRTVPNNTLLLVTGSLYLAGAVREYWIPKRKILITKRLF